jgi:hypothetical protein
MAICTATCTVTHEWSKVTLLLIVFFAFPVNSGVRFLATIRSICSFRVSSLIDAPTAALITNWIDGSSAAAATY